MDDHAQTASPIPTLELVVARYDEDLGWLRRVPNAFRVTVYDKSGSADQGIALPNIGNETHTYFQHLETRYDDLADITVFCQGHPFDHVPSLHRQLRELAEGTLTIRNGFHWLGFIIDEDDPTGSRVFQSWSKNTDHRPLDMAGFWHALWPAPVPERFTFYPGGQFMLTAEQAHAQPRDFYAQAKRVCTEHPDGGHCFERCWDRVFGVNGIPEEFRDREFPVYLRPIRRLGLTWDTVPPEHRGWGEEDAER